MENLIQLTIRQEDNRMVIVGVITSKLPLFEKDDQGYLATIRFNARGTTFSMMQDSPINYSKEVDLSYGAQVNDLLTSKIWCSYKENTLNETGGMLSVRLNQLFKDESGYRYIVCGAWKDTADIFKEVKDDFYAGGKSFFLEGKFNNLSDVSLEKTIIDIEEKQSVNHVLFEPLWGNNNSIHGKYRLFSDLRLDLLNDVSIAQKSVIEGKNINDLPISTEVHNIMSISRMNKDFIRFMNMMESTRFNIEAHQYLLSELDVADKNKITEKLIKN